MNALILSCATGGGHNSCAHAVARQLEEDGWKADVLDPFTLDSKLTAKLVGSAYVDLVQKSPRTFGFVYKLGAAYENLERYLPLPSPVLDAQKRTARKLAGYLSEHSYDVIICTHMYPGMMITILKEEGYPLVPSMLITTDYTCIPFETQADCDWTVIAAKGIRKEFKKWHLKDSEILPFGIPVDPRFEKPLSRKEAKKKIGLDPDRKILLLGAGSMGFSGIDEELDQVELFLGNHPEFDLLVLCGNSQKLISDVLVRNNPRIMGIPFTTDVPDFLHAADIYMTKPGGLSITEAAVVGVPLLLTSPIPGCETKNAEFFEKKDMALFARSKEEVGPFLEQLLNPQIARAIILNQRHHIPRHSSRRIADWAMAAAIVSKEMRKSGATQVDIREVLSQKDLENRKNEEKPE